MGAFGYTTGLSVLNSQKSSAYKTIVVRRGRAATCVN